MNVENASLAETVVIRQLGLQPYAEIWHQMQTFTDNRAPTTKDEIWLVEHPAIFTQGQTGKAEHLLQMSQIPVVQTDRGGQITYHGPGQQIMYVLIDIKRKKVLESAVENQEFLTKPTALSVRQLVTSLEQCVVNTLADYGVTGYPKAEAPGVYVEERKICSLGLRIRRGCSFHGLALNINMDLSPFHQINPCGYVGLEMCQLAELTKNDQLTCEQVAPHLIKHFTQLLHYNYIEQVNGF